MQVLPNGLVKHALQVALSECGALEILMCADLLGDGQGLLVRDWLHFAGAQGFGRGAIISQVELGADEDDGDIGGVVFDFGVPLVFAVRLVNRMDGRPDMATGRTLAFTLSKDGGLTIEKQIRKTSVCG